MTTFTWGGATFSVREMTRAGAFQCSMAYQRYLDTQPSDEAAIVQEIDWLFVQHAPVTVVLDGQALDPGVHAIAGAVVTLPLTRDVFEALPVSLAAAWAQAAEAANPYMVGHFLAYVTRTATLMQSVSAPVSASVPSAAPETPTPATATPTTGT